MQKTIDYYMGLRYSMVLTPDREEGGWALSFPALPGCITCADTLQEVLALADDARRAWIEAALDSGYPIAEEDCDKAA